jgi:hypothetical protein
MIWFGCIAPWSVSSRRIVTSVIEPAPWWPRIGIPLIFEMSTLSPVLPAASVPFWPAPHTSPETEGSSPEPDRNSSAARTRRSTSPAWMSRRPQA